MESKTVFKALADPSRRMLLDLLFVRDGRSLSDLESNLTMTRFGVMKHLRVLKDAGLVSTRKSGRETLHYLNAVPIQMVYDRWVSKYSKGWARSLTELKYDLEDETMEDMRMTAERTENTTKVFEIYIKTTAEKLWQALTDGEMTRKYYFGTRFHSDLNRNSSYTYTGDDGAVLLDGEVLESVPNRKLVTTFRPHWGGADGYPESLVTYEIEPTGAICKLTLTHERMMAAHPMTEGIREGWSKILSGLKTVLETGKTLDETV